MKEALKSKLLELLVGLETTAQNSLFKKSAFSANRSQTNNKSDITVLLQRPRNQSPVSGGQILSALQLTALINL